ncbi:MAG TPA: hypothetical protein VM513_36385 [Kofleriaceae bacterium]|nr:hypothetical protein [Kofleriaceae bacterium]
MRLGLVVALLAVGPRGAGASRPEGCPHDVPPGVREDAPFAWMFEPAPPSTAPTVHIDCAEGGCRVERTIVVSNPTSAPYDGLLVGTGNVHVEPGASLKITLANREGLYFDFPRRAHEVPLGCDGSEAPVPIDTRHMLLGRWHDREPRSASATVSQRGAADVAITYPRGWDLHVSGGTAPVPAADGTPRIVVRAPMQDSFTITRTLPAASWLRRGGPFIGAGGSGPDKQMRFAMRAGYELATPGWLIYSAAVETDFERVTVVPAIEAALSTAWAVHWAVGAGVPVEVTGDPAIGARAQLALQMSFLAMVLTFDRFPSRDATIIGAYGQLSL